MAKYDKDSANRIGKQTRRLERTPVNQLKGRQRRPLPVSSIPKSLCIELFGDPQDGSFKITIQRNRTDENGETINGTPTEIEIAANATASEIVAAFVSQGDFDADEVSHRNSDGLPLGAVQIYFKNGCKLKDVYVTSTNLDGLSDCCHRPYIRIRRIGE